MGALSGHGPEIVVPSLVASVAFSNHWRLNATTRNGGFA